jgi:hypothetical protein
MNLVNLRKTLKNQLKYFEKKKDQQKVDKIKERIANLKNK